MVQTTCIKCLFIDGIVIIASLDYQKKQVQICAKYATYFLSSVYDDCFACFWDSFA